MSSDGCVGRVVCLQVGVSAGWCVFRWVCRQGGVSSCECVGRVVCLQVSVSAGWSVFGCVCRQGGLSSGGCVGSVVCLCYVQYGCKVDHAFVEEGDKTVCIIFILHCENISLSKPDFFPHGKMQPVSISKSHVRQSVALPHSDHRFPAPSSKLCQI